MADATPLNGHSDGPVDPLKHDAQRQNRVAVHSFDENASPAEKAAAAGKAREQLKPINTNNGHVERGQLLSLMLYPPNPLDSSFPRGAHCYR
jgi:hypothetical protein